MENIYCNDRCIRRGNTNYIDLLMIRYTYLISNYTLLPTQYLPQGALIFYYFYDIYHVALCGLAHTTY